VAWLARLGIEHLIVKGVQSLRDPRYGVFFHGELLALPGPLPSLVRVF
jgi:hypothetical protein